MSDSSGFIDLRIGHGAQGVGDDSVWPSFTDIMTVIVMIFLMALVVIMVRNFELDRELLSTIYAKEATSLANEDLVQKLISMEDSLEDTQEQRDSLQQSLTLELERLAALSAEQALLQSELESVIGKREVLKLENLKFAQEQEAAFADISRLSDSEVVLNQRVADLSEQFSELELKSSEKISALTSTSQSLEENLETVSSQLAEVKQLLIQSKTKNESLVRNVTELKTLKQNIEDRYLIVNEEILALTALIQQREAENSALEAQALTSSDQYQSLQDEFKNLDEKYRDLIRAARSTAGKYVVEVWVEKINEQLEYKIRESHQINPRTMEKSQLDSTLLDLKQRFGNALYTKIIIPETSQLSHNEAWEFTQEILERYDYYYQ